MKRVIALALIFAAVFGLNARADVAAADENSEIEQSIIEAASAMRRSGLVQFNLTDMDIVRFIRFMAELFGENIVIPSGLKQKVTIISPHPVTLSEAWNIMQSALKVNGLHLEREGAHYLLVQNAANPPQTVRIETVSGDVVKGILSAQRFMMFTEYPLLETHHIRFRLNEKLQGLEVLWLSTQSIFRSMGVQRGDTITALNGIRLGNIRSLRAIIDSLLKGESFDIELVRDGRTIKLLNSIERTQ